MLAGTVFCPQISRALRLYQCISKRINRLNVIGAIQLGQISETIASQVDWVREVLMIVLLASIVRSRLL
ncbi:hypothetical protein Lsha_2014 [Legionella shakespearei DSM 23087]|uniref:Uncharacterized protein n=1 Tax=Legionella shakespearei DSM 23087 TaxID=1122169 RepID=A0A0W0YQX5_9GAMM|nr:hypothetical protein Lsha_2014 [Legionella shakespearei DSM 23087]